MQTPLAVISSNLEQLLQAQNLSQNQLEQIGGLLDTTGRLARMNQTLLLLTKIENRQFGATEKVDFSRLLAEKLTLWEPLMQHKGLALHQQISPGVEVLVNPQLWERFRKDSTNPDSLGLGLALVAKICETSGLRVRYDFEEGWHGFFLMMNDES